jgi:outer membrane protein insertion porin family
VGDYCLIRVFALFALICLMPMLATPATAQPAAASPRAASPGAPTRATNEDTLEAVTVVGNQRIEAGTIQSYMTLQVGDPFDPARMDASLKTLFATGLFSDVNLKREGNSLVVTVTENPIVNRIAFEGNHLVTDEQARTIVQLKPRAVFTAAQAQDDRQHLLDAYARRGRFSATVTPKIIRLPDNRVDVVFEINDGPSTLISRISFVGNHAFSEDKLREVINSRETIWWRFLSTSDSYDPERSAFDRELLRRFYLKNGYVDFKVDSSNAELAPDRSSFFLTYTLSEGERYRVASVTIKSTLPHVSDESLRGDLQLGVGDWYDGDAVERTVTAMSDDVQSRDIAFVEVRPEISRDSTKHTVDLVFNVINGPRVYVERINIDGNTRTEDKVIRREFRLAEGDALNAAAIRRSRQRLTDLGYFSNVSITNAPGSTPDKTVVNTTVVEKSTGELSFGGGYSTDAGALLNAGLRERNLVGTGIDAGLNGTLGTKESQIDLSASNPYFLDRNLVAGFDIFDITNNNQVISDYDEKRVGFTVNLGYEFNDHLRQTWNYSLVNRDVYDVASTASIYILNQQGTTLLSQLGQTFTIDYRDSRTDAHRGFVVRLGTDFAGLGGSVRFVRTKVDTSYYFPLDSFTGNSDWTLVVSGGSGYFFQLGQNEQIIDNFFLGGDNLRGFASGGAGPHDELSGDSLGGRFIWTQSTELRFPLPISADLGLSGRTFVDVGALSQATQYENNPVSSYSGPRVGAGVGISWKTPFGLINIDVADAVVKYHYDKTQLFRFGFGTRF